MKNEVDVRNDLLAVLAAMDKTCEYKANADIFEDFGLDSLDQIEFLYNVEGKFGVKIEEETFADQDLRNFDKLARFLVQAGG